MTIEGGHVTRAHLEMTRAHLEGGRDDQGTLRGRT